MNIRKLKVLYFIEESRCKHPGTFHRYMKHSLIVNEYCKKQKKILKFYRYPWNERCVQCSWFITKGRSVNCRLETISLTSEAIHIACTESIRPILLCDRSATTVTSPILWKDSMCQLWLNWLRSRCRPINWWKLLINHELIIR